MLSPDIMLGCPLNKYEEEMPFQIKWDQHRVVINYSGISNDKDLTHMLELIHTNRRFDEVHQTLHDFRECIKVEYSGATLEDIVARNVGASISNPHRKVAVLGDRPDVQEAVAKYESFGVNPYPIAVFATYEEADAWLRS